MLIASERIYAALQFTGEKSELSAAANRALNHIIFNAAQGQREPIEIGWSIVNAELVKRVLHSTFAPDDYRALLSLGDMDLTNLNRCFCLIEEQSHSGTAILAECVGEKIFAWHLDQINFMPQAAPLQRLPLKNVDKLRAASAVVVGAGSGGGELALNFAAAGVGKLILVDSDRVHQENYFRSIFDRRHLGRAKVVALSESIANRDLPTEVVSEHMDVLWGADFFRDLLMEKPSLVVCATDSVLSRRFVNYCCVKFNIPLIIAGTFKAGQIGEVMLVKPYEGPCYECTRFALGGSLEQTDFDNVGHYTGAEEHTLNSSALRSDVTAIASFATRLALAELDPEQFPSLPTRYFAFGRESQIELGSPFNFAYPLTSHYVPISRNKKCAVCGSSPDVSREVDITSEAQSIIDNVH